MAADAARQLNPEQPEINPGDMLAGARLGGQDLSGMNLMGCDLSGADLSMANLQGARLTGANLRGAIFHRANIASAQFLGCDATDADFSEVEGAEAVFGSAELSGTNFFAAKMPEATFTQANLAGSDMRAANFEGARFRESKLVGADLSRTNMQGADLSEASLERAVFVDADLRETRLRHVKDFGETDWIGVDIAGADFAGAYLVRRSIIDQNYLYEFKNRSRTSEIVYWIWWVTSDCGRSLMRWAMWTALVAVVFALAYTTVSIDYGDYRTALSPLYFSLVTLTTLGYGDVLPASLPAQTLVLAEVVTGYVMLGGLLSIFANKMGRRGE